MTATWSPEALLVLRGHTTTGVSCSTASRAVTSTAASSRRSPVCRKTDQLEIYLCLLMMHILNASRIIELLRRDLVCGLRKKLSNHVLAKHATYHPSPCLLLLLTLPHCVTRHFVSSITTLSTISAAVSVSVFMFLLLGMVSTCVSQPVEDLKEVF